MKVESGAINVPTANGTSLGVAKQGTNVTVGSDGAISVATGSTTAKGVVKVGDNIQVSDGTIGVKHAGAGDTSKPGVLTTVKDKTVVGTDADGNLKEATKTEGSTVATKEYVDAAVVVDPKFSSGTNVADIAVVGTKKEVKVPIASESTAGLIKTVKNASFVGTNANGELVKSAIPYIVDYGEESDYPVPGDNTIYRYRAWCKWSNGYCEQWGYSNWRSDSTDFTIDLKHAYTNRRYSVSCIGENDTSMDTDADPLTHRACDNLDVSISDEDTFLILTWSFMLPVHNGTDTWQHSSPPSKVRWRTVGFCTV